MESKNPVEKKGLVGKLTMKFLWVNWGTSLKEIIERNLLPRGWERILLGLILLSCATVRLWTLEVPALDRTHWKEIDYMMVSSNYWENGYHFFQPEISWPAEPPRVTAMEFPVVPFAAALLYHWLGFNVYSVRLVPLFSFLLLTFYVFRLARRELGSTVGLLAAMATAIMPLYHQFRNILFSEPLMIAMSVMALYHFAQWVDLGRRVDWAMAMGSFSLAVALKIEPLFLLLPLLWTAFRKYKWQVGEYKSFCLLVLFALLLPVAWYSYAYYLGKNEIDVFGIFGGHNKMQTLTMLSDPAWYRKMYGQVAWHILGGKIGTLFCLVGLGSAVIIRRGGLFFLYLLAVGIYFAIVAEGQIDAPYRQLNSIPPLSSFVGLGAISIAISGMSLVNAYKDWNLQSSRKNMIFLLGGLLLISLIAVKNNRGIFGQDPFRPMMPERWELALEIKKHADRDSKLVTVGEYTLHVGGNDLSPVLYHYSGLQGWTLQRGQWDIQRVQSLVKKGATHFAAIQMSREPEADPFLKEMKSRYKILFEGEDKFLLDLRQPVER